MLENVLNGRPWALEVEAILKRLRERMHREDDRVAYDDLLPLMPTAKSWREPRFSALTRKARKQFETESGVRLAVVPGVGLRYPSGEQQMDKGKRGVKGAIRKVGRDLKSVVEITDDRLPDPKQRAQRDFFGNRMKYMIGVMKAERKALEAHVGTPTPNPQ